MSKTTIDVSKMSDDKFEVTISGLRGLAVRNNGIWEVSPNVRKYAKSITKKIESELKENVD